MKHAVKHRVMSTVRPAAEPPLAPLLAPRLWPRSATLLLIAALAGAASAQDRAELDRTQIIGHKELPKVLYIVPWKKPLPGELAGRPRSSLLDEVLAPLDRAEFRRALHHRSQIEPSSLPSTPAKESPP